MERIVEICCGGYEDALNAYRGGAKRIELNSALHLGGLTPSLASLILTKQNTDLEVICMVRPRGAGFCYSENEFEVMKYDAKLFMENGCDGLAFGFLDKIGNIDKDKTKQMIDIVKLYHGATVFHRAFDCVSNPYEAIEILIDLGIDRILTSGLENKAMDGKSLIKDLQVKYGHQIQILAGSGINATNAKTIMNETGIYQVH
ncbi:MAG: copper homeostasis protein CutC, partial [Erysipelotrichaceae bacterium]|nr:copper homeostasis protein CutC [Erysipelotrichaceae bacterium]